MVFWTALAQAYCEALPNGHKNGFSSGALDELEPFFMWSESTKNTVSIAL